MAELTRESAVAFADQLRFARSVALRDAEAFEEIVHVLERLGGYLKGYTRRPGLGEYKCELIALALKSPLAWSLPNQDRSAAIPFDDLYKLVQDARNDAMHQGAFARHLTSHAVQVAIILEDALTSHKHRQVSDFMVRNPVCAEVWQSVGIIRQQMLASSFSCLPVLRGDRWFLVTDIMIASYLRNEDRRERLTTSLEDAFEKLVPPPISVEPAADTFPIDEALVKLERDPVLLVHYSAPNANKSILAGILTAFDLL